MKRWVYRFEEGSREMRDLLGGKGADLAEMTRLGLPVPPGFTITTEACRAYLGAESHRFPEEMWEQAVEPYRPWARRWAAPSGTLRTRSWSRCVVARNSPCPG